MNIQIHIVNARNIQDKCLPNHPNIYCRINKSKWLLYEHKKKAILKALRLLFWLIVVRYSHIFLYKAFNLLILSLSLSLSLALCLLKRLHSDDFSYIDFFLQHNR